MNRKEYLKKLQQQIQALPVEEQEEALDFYRNYFEDADNDAQVIEKLGTPEKLAESIKEKFACVPAKTQSAGNGKEDGRKADNEDYKKQTSSTGRSCVFKAKDVRSLDMSLGAAEIILIPGEDYTVETRGMEKYDLRCELSPYGTLSIDNAWKIPFVNCFNRGSRKDWHPRILITIPDGAVLDMLKIHVGAGSLETRSINVKCSRASLDVGAGNMVIDKLLGGRVDIRCGVGNLELEGTITGFSKIVCGMGNVELNLSGDKSTYSYDAKIGLGEVKLNSEKKSGFGETVCQDRKENHFSVQCGMGSVAIDIR